MKIEITLTRTLLPGLLLAPLAALHAAGTTDPFASYLNGKAPPIPREIAQVPDDITVRRVLFRIRERIKPMPSPRLTPSGCEYDDLKIFPVKP